MAEYALSHLGDETWGERFGRARERKGLTLREAAAKISLLRLVSYGTLVRLEDRATPPTDRRQRQAAYIASLLYGIDPSDFLLTDADRPPVVTKEVLIQLRESTGWYPQHRETAGQRWLAVVGPQRFPGFS